MLNLAQRSIGWLCGATLFAFIAYQAVLHWNDLPKWQLPSPDVMFIATSLLILAFAIFFKSWHSLLPKDNDPLSSREHYIRWGISLLGKYIPGKVWHGISRIYLYRDHINNHWEIGTHYVAEQLLSLSAAALIVTLFLWWEPHSTSALRWGTTLLTFILLSAGISPLLIRLARCLQRWSKSSAQIEVIPIRQLAVSFALLSCAYLLLGSSFYTLISAFIELSPMRAASLIAGLCFSGIAGIAAFFLPAGLGAREAAMVWFLSPFFSLGESLQLALLSRVWLTLGELTVISLAFLMRIK